MSYRVALSFSILLALAGCSKMSIPLNPQIIVNRELVGFGTEQGLGTYIGTSPQDSLDIKNGGTQDLVVTDLSSSGDSAFTYIAPQLPASVRGLQHVFVTFYFTPTAARSYSATFTITSNAENTATKVINLRGQGVNPPDGGT